MWSPPSVLPQRLVSLPVHPAPDPLELRLSSAPTVDHEVQGPPQCQVAPPVAAHVERAQEPVTSNSPNSLTSLGNAVRISSRAVPGLVSSRVGTVNGSRPTSHSFGWGLVLSTSTSTIGATTGWRSSRTLKLVMTSCVGLAYRPASPVVSHPLAQSARGEWRLPRDQDGRTSLSTLTGRIH